MYLKFVLFFLYHNLISFSKKNDKKPAQMFNQNHSLALQRLRYFAFSFKKSLGLDLKISD